MNRKFAVIGVGNMARAIISGIVSTDIDVCGFIFMINFLWLVKHMLIKNAFI